MKRSFVSTQLTLITGREFFTPGEIDYLKSQNVNTDDWAYMVIAPVNCISAREINIQVEGSLLKRVRYHAIDWSLERLLQGQYCNDWYKVTFRGEEIALGVARDL